MRHYILAGFALMFVYVHQSGNLNKYINTKYAYISIIAIILFAVLFLFEFVKLAKREEAQERRKLAAEEGVQLSEEGDCCREHAQHHDHSGHSHAIESKPKRILGYLILLVPILTGFLLPIQTLDSSFVKAKGFSFPAFNGEPDDPGYHQFLKPDTSVFYGKEGYEEVSNRERKAFGERDEVYLTDIDYLRGMEAIYNFPGAFMNKSISFEGFVYEGEHADKDHYFVFRFGFIHCVADSGVFGMLVEFPDGTTLKNDQWVRVSGTLGSEFYQPFKQTIPVLRITEWNPIDTPSDPYVYRA